MRKWILIWLACLLAAGTAMAQPSSRKDAGLFRKRQLPSDYVAQVNNFFSQHRWAKGKELLDEGLEEYPGDATLHYLAGRYWWNGKNWDRARYHLVKACQINYHYVDAKTLLVNVEEITGNYSSAVCYVNELLEVNPYWKGLWLRKVDLYKKMGNFEEANILLKRLSQIYPNDASVSGDYLDVLETSYQQARTNGDINAQEETLREIVRLNPTDPEYQLLYANILIRRGKLNDALDNLLAAVNLNPGNVPLIRKAADIMMEMGRDIGALTFVRGQQAQYPSPELSRLYESLLAESARLEDEADPYQLYTRTYIKDQSMEALQYLLTQSVKRGYNEDALFYIREMRRRQGDSPKWYMMEYDVYSRMGRPEAANRSLREGMEKFPGDYDLNLASSSLNLSEAGQCMAEERYADAIPLLEWVHDRSVETELRMVATRRLAVCYRETAAYDRAEAMLRERLQADPEYQVTVDYATLLKRQGKTEQALASLQASWQQAADSTARRQLGNAYRETAYPFVRDKLSAGDTRGVQPVLDTMLAIDPEDYWGLRYSLRTSDHPLEMARRGMKAYPDDLSFPLKAASILSEQGHDREALDLLEPYLKVFASDEDLQRTYAGISDQYATRLLKAHDYDQARAVLDSALAVRPADPSVRYTRGRVFEKDKQWDSAYVYQSAYRPAVLEEREYLAHMDAIRARTLRNTADAGYDLFRFADKDRLTAIASLGYSRLFGGGMLQARVNYTGRDTEVEEGRVVEGSEGGRGYQFLLGGSYDLGRNWTVQANAGYGSNYFPRWVADASLTWHLPADWDAEGGVVFRQLQDRHLMLGGILNGTHTWEHFYAGAKVMAGGLYGLFFVNGSARLRFYPIDGGRSYIEAQAGAGTAPELSFLDYYHLDTNVFNQLNTFAALSAQWALYYNLAMQCSVTWNTLYDQRESVRYRNLLIAHVSFSLSF